MNCCPQVPHYISFHIVAQKLAQHPEFRDNRKYQEQVCWEHGIPLDDMADDEVEFLSRLVEQYYNKGV